MSIQKVILVALVGFSCLSYAEEGGMAVQTICQPEDSSNCIHIQAKKITVRDHNRVRTIWNEGDRQRSRTTIVPPEETKTIVQ